MTPFHFREESVRGGNISPHTLSVCHITSRSSYRCKHRFSTNVLSAIIGMEWKKEGRKEDRSFLSCQRGKGERDIHTAGRNVRFHLSPFLLFRFAHASSVFFFSLDIGGGQKGKGKGNEKDGRSHEVEAKGKEMERKGQPRNTPSLTALTRLFKFEESLTAGMFSSCYVLLRRKLLLYLRTT